MEGIVYLRTDDADYFEQMIGVFAASPLFRPPKTPEELVAISTDFEKTSMRAESKRCGPRIKPRRGSDINHVVIVGWIFPPLDLDA